MNIRRFAKIAILVAMICFIFPFMTVSCSGQTVDVSGMEVMTNITMQNGALEAMEDGYPNVFLIAAMALDIIGAILVWKAQDRKRWDLIAGCCASSAVLFLLAFRATIWDYYGVADYRFYITLEYRWGYYFSVISDVAVAILSFILAFEKDSESSVTSRLDDSKVETDDSRPVGGQLDKHVEDDNSGGYVQDPYSPPTDFTDEDEQEEDDDAQDDSPGNVLYVIINMFGIDKDERIEVTSFPYVIGRNKGACDFSIEDPKISSVHARIFLDDEAVFIEDLKSKNGTLVNGEKINEPEEILSGDEVLMGDTRLVFEIGIE